MMDHGLGTGVEVVFGVIGSLIGLLVAVGLGLLVRFVWVGLLVRFIWKPLLGSRGASGEGAPRTPSSQPSRNPQRLPWYDYVWAGLPFFLLWPTWGGGFLGGVLGGGGFLLNASLLGALRDGRLHLATPLLSVGLRVIAYLATIGITVAMGFAYNEGAGWF